MKNMQESKVKLWETIKGVLDKECREIFEFQKKMLTLKVPFEPYL